MPEPVWYPRLFSPLPHSYQAMRLLDMDKDSAQPLPRWMVRSMAGKSRCPAVSAAGAIPLAWSSLTRAVLGTLAPARIGRQVLRVIHPAHRPRHLPAVAGSMARARRRMASIA